MQVQPVTVSFAGLVISVPQGDRKLSSPTLWVNEQREMQYSGEVVLGRKHYMSTLSGFHKQF